MVFYFSCGMLCYVSHWIGNAALGDVDSVVYISQQKARLMSSTPAGENFAFSSTIPGLQLVWDSVSLGALKKCPRYYQLSILEGWQPRKKRVDLEFGIFAHSCREQYYHAKATGKSHDEALDRALDWLLRATWDVRLGRPWATDDSNKNRGTLVRSMVWYLDQYASDALETVILASGKPAVELSFRYEITHKAADGTPFSLAGHLDRIAKMNGQTFLSDLKTTKHTVDQRYRESFTPDNQFSLYAYSAPIVFGEGVSGGILVDSIQVAVSFSRMERFIVPRPQALLDEWYEDLGSWLRMAEGFARAQKWPMNEKSCFLCEFRGICSRSPAMRQQWLQADFVQRVWDCTVARGDV